MKHWNDRNIFEKIALLIWITLVMIGDWFNKILCR